MGYAGLRIGEAEQLCWEDLHTANGRYTTIHVRRGGSAGTAKDKDDAITLEVYVQTITWHIAKHSPGLDTVRHRCLICIII